MHCNHDAEYERKQYRLQMLDRKLNLLQQLLTTSKPVCENTITSLVNECHALTTAEDEKPTVSGAGTMVVNVSGPVVERPKYFPFGVAIDALVQGERVHREGWNGKGMHVELQVPDAGSKMSMPYMYLCYPNGGRVPWVPSQTDVLATDWSAV